MVEEVFQNLVDQFSDPFTCLRELIQNAMDAGTEGIDVRTRYLPDPGGICLEIRDFGEGMTREIIEGKLTRLFSSDKEDDLTKIGKFGIGFVSVFSLKPELVLVDTGRDGEYWRIAFDGGTDFQLFELHEPIEGTSVRLYRSLAYEQYDEFVQRALDTVRRWCRHSATSILFNGEEITEPFAVESPCRIENESALGHFSVGLHPAESGPFGLYNSGLTLMEGEQEALPGVTFKILSNQLEHTLTRDAVIQDEGYDRVMKRLEELVNEELFEQVWRQLGDPERSKTTAEAATRHLLWKRGRLTRAEKRKVLLEDLHQRPVTWRDLEKTADREQRLFATVQASPLSERASQEGIPVLAFSATGREARLFEQLFEVPVAPLEESLAVSRPVSRPAGFQALESSLRRLLRMGRIHVTSVVPVEYPGSLRQPDDPPCHFSLGSQHLVRRYRKGFWGSRYVLPQQLLLDVDHPLVRKCLARLEDQRALRVASYALCKSALLDDGLDPRMETRLMETLVEVSV